MRSSLGGHDQRTEGGIGGEGWAALSSGRRRAGRAARRRAGSGLAEERQRATRWSTPGSKAGLMTEGLGDARDPLPREAERPVRAGERAGREAESEREHRANGPSRKRAGELEAGLLDGRLAPAGGEPAGRLAHDPVRARSQLAEDVCAVGGRDVVLELDRLLLDAVAEQAQLGRATRDGLCRCARRGQSAFVRADEPRRGAVGLGTRVGRTFLCSEGVMGCRLWKRSLLSVSLGS